MPGGMLDFKENQSSKSQGALRQGWLSHLMVEGAEECSVVSDSHKSSYILVLLLISCHTVPVPTEMELGGVRSSLSLGGTKAQGGVGTSRQFNNHQSWHGDLCPDQVLSDP